jgi:hypothetical protein
MAHRTFRDGHGRTWDVWEVRPTLVERRELAAQPPPSLDRRRYSHAPSLLPADLRQGWLAFQWKQERRRLGPPPVGWIDMSDDELAELLERAVPSGRVRRLIE